MSTLTFPELKELDGKIKAKQDEMGKLISEGNDNGVLDLSKVKSISGSNTEKAAYIKGLNDELTALATEAAPLRDLKALAEARGREGGDGEGDDGSEAGADGEGDSRKAKSFSDLYFESKSRTEKNREFEIDVDVKTLFSLGAGWAADSTRSPRFVDYATRPIELLDFIPTAPMANTSFTYMEETTFTNAAVEVAEGAAKPEAALALTERTATARKIAVYITTTDEQLDDVPAAKAYLDARLPFMVRQRLSGQIVAGDGSAPNIRGILNTSGIQTQAKGSDPTPDAVYKAATLVRTTGQAEPDAVIFNPLDWQDVRLLRTADGIYIWGNPSEAGPEMIWGLRVILAQAMTENTAVVGAWRQYSTLFIRKGLTVETGYNGTDWIENQQTVRAEMRVVPVFWRPSAFCKVTGI